MEAMSASGAHERGLESGSRGGRDKKPLFVYVLTGVSALGGFLFGYDTGVVSGAMILVRNRFNLNHVWHELVVSVTVAAAWFFSLIGGNLSDKCGRKPMILGASFLFTCGAVVMGAANDKETLLAGRVIVGVAIGLQSSSLPAYVDEGLPERSTKKSTCLRVAFPAVGHLIGALVAGLFSRSPRDGWRVASCVVPVYIAELSPSDERGRLVTINNIFITGGQFVAGVLCGAFASDPLHGWRYMLGLSGVPAFLQFVSFLGMPESPRWLVMKGRPDQALHVLRSIRGSSVAVDEELRAIRLSCEEDDPPGESVGTVEFIGRLFTTPHVRRALILGCALMLFQQLAGINTVMYYSAAIIQMSGIRDDVTAIWLAAATAAVNFLCTFIGLFLVERVGRRPLTLGSLAGVVISLVVLAVGFQLTDLQAPPVTLNDFNSSCSSYGSCALCTSNPNCGFCYAVEDANVVNSSCLPVASNSSKISAGGHCVGPESNYDWAFGWCPSHYTWITLLGLVLYLFWFAPGMGPMPWTINSEIYPLWARGASYSLATSICWAANVFVSMTFLTFTEILTKEGTFYLYGALALIGLVIFSLILPETKGLELEEVEGLFARPWCSSGGGDSAKTIQYVHIRGLNRAYRNSNDSGDEET